MRSKVGVYVRESQIDVLAISPETPAIVGELGSFELKVKNIYADLTLDDEKILVSQSEATRKILEAKKLTELDASVVIPDEKCSLQIIKLPLVSEKEILSAIELQSEEFVPYPIDKASFDYQVLSIDKEHNEMYLLLIVALKELIDQISDYVLSIGLYPTGIEPESTAFYRLIFNQVLTVPESLVMFINIGENSTQISILNRTQQQLVTTNNLSIGNIFFYKSLENNLNIPREAAKELFKKLGSGDQNVTQIITPTFGEFAKDINKILLSALDKLGSLPKQIYLYSHEHEETFVSLFKAHPILQPYSIFPFHQAVIQTSKVRLEPKVTQKLNQYLVSLGAVV